MRFDRVWKRVVSCGVVAYACVLGGLGGAHAQPAAVTFDAQTAYAREAQFTVRPFDAKVDGVWAGHALSYGPHRDGQAPGREPGPTEAQMLEDMRILAQRWHMIRVYGADADTQRLLEVIRKHGIRMKVLLGAWIEPADMPARVQENQRQIETAIALANRFPEIVVAVNVGNETQVGWSSHKVDPDLLIRGIRAVRAAIKQPVTTADDYNFWNKPKSRAVAQEVDFVLLHLYALWNGQQVDNAVAWTEQTVQTVKTLHPDRDIIIGETGWATTYNPAANAPGQQGYLIKGVVGDAAQTAYYQAMSAWVDRTHTVVFHFEAFDENWKGGGDSAGPYEVEKHWGLFDAQRRPKPAVRAWFPELPPAPPSLVGPPPSRTAAPLPKVSLPRFDHPMVRKATIILGPGHAPVAAPSWWGDEATGATSEPQVPTGRAWFVAQGATGTGWGLGWSIHFAADHKDGIDMSGATQLVLQAKVSRGAQFQVLIEEAGAAATDVGTYEGVRQADGESLQSPKLTGTGAWKTYVIALKDFTRRPNWGNQKGKLQLDTQAISWLDLVFAGGQGTVRAELGPVTARP